MIPSVQLEALRSLPSRSAGRDFGWQLVEATERALSGIVLLALSPMLALVAMSLAMLSGRSPFIAHLRVGQYGRDLWVWKFRTMWQRSSAGRIRLVEYITDEVGPAEKSLADGRVVSAFARFCRRHSIDELPQLLHVVRGEMALVGPRPVTRRESHDIFGEDAGEVLLVKPGLTGLWQVSGRNRLSTEQRRRLDLQMARGRSARLYLSILLRTVPELIGGSNSW